MASEAPCAAEEAAPEECRSPAPRKTAVRHIAEECGMLRHLAEEGRPAENSTAYSVILRRCREFERRSNSAFSFFFFSPKKIPI